jgi:hypothetical protein
MAKKIGSFEITVSGVGEKSYSGELLIQEGERGWLGAKMNTEKISIFYNLARDGKTIDLEIRGARVRHEVLAIFSFILPENGAELQTERVDRIPGHEKISCTIRRREAP